MKAAETIPDSLIEQLAPGGSMVLKLIISHSLLKMIPVGPEDWLQNIVIVKKDSEGKVTQNSVMEVVSKELVFIFLEICALNRPREAMA